MPHFDNKYSIPLRCRVRSGTQACEYRWIWGHRFLGIKTSSVQSETSAVLWHGPVKSWVFPLLISFLPQSPERKDYGYIGGVRLKEKRIALPHVRCCSLWCLPVLIVNTEGAAVRNSGLLNRCTRTREVTRLSVDKVTAECPPKQALVQSARPLKMLI